MDDYILSHILQSRNYADCLGMTSLPAGWPSCRPRVSKHWMGDPLQTQKSTKCLMPSVFNFHSKYRIILPGDILVVRNICKQSEYESGMLLASIQTHEPPILNLTA